MVSLAMSALRLCEQAWAGHDPKVAMQCYF